MSLRPRLGFGLALLAALVWSATAPGIKVLFDVYHLPNLTVALWRDVIIAGCLVGFFGVFRPQILRVQPSELGSLATVGGVAIGLHHALLVFSIMLNGAGLAIVLTYTFPAFVTLGSWILFKNRPRGVEIAALGCSLLGCVLLSRAYDPSVLRLSWLGTVIGLACGLAHAVYVLYSQRSVQTRSPWTSLTYTMLFGTLALLVMTLVARPSDVLAMGADPMLWLVLAAIALGPTLGGYALFTLALRFIPGPTASLVAVVEAPAAAALAFLTLGERLDGPQLIGVALIVFAAVAPGLLSQRTVTRSAALAEAQVS